MLLGKLHFSLVQGLYAWCYQHDRMLVGEQKRTRNGVRAPELMSLALTNQIGLRIVCALFTDRHLQRSKVHQLGLVGPLLFLEQQSSWRIPSK